MADRIITFSPNKTSVSMTTSWGIFYTPGSSTDTTPTSLSGGSATVSFAISGITLGANENIKKIVLTSTRSNSGTIDSSARLTMNGVNYTTTKKLDVELTNGTNFEVGFYLIASGKAGNPGPYIAPNYYSMTTTISNMVLTVTIGTGNAFDGKVSSLNEGDKIMIQESENSLVPYTLVHHNYNDGKALIFRDAPLDTTVSWSYNYDPDGDTAFISSTLDNYLNGTWYSSLPGATRQFLQTIDYPVAARYEQSPDQEFIPRNACTISAIEADGNGDSLYGTMLNYLDTIICGSDYWTREHSYYSAGYKAKYIGKNGGVYTVGAQTKHSVRPTLGLLEDQTVIYSESDGGYIFCTKCTAPTTVKINNGTTNITNAQSNASYTLSWSGAAAGTNAPIVGYDVWYSTSANGTYSFYGTTTSTSMLVSGPEKGYQSYYFKVQTLTNNDMDYCNSDLSSTSRAISTKKSNLYYYDGTRWLIGLPKYWNGSAWVEGNSTNYYNGSSWKKPT